MTQNALTRLNDDTMTPRYQTAQAFRQALETRLMQQSALSRVDVMRLRRMVAFDRLLARLFTEQDALGTQEGKETPWLLKGGYAMELRLGYRARATRDIDLALPVLRTLIDKTGSKDITGVAGIESGIDDPIQGAGRDQAEALTAIRERLQEEADRDLGDWFAFRVGSPIVELDAAPYGGARFPVEALLANRRFITFHLDVGVGDATVGSAEWIAGNDLLEFAGIPRARIAALPIEQQFAEKIHAYTLPRTDRENTRVKDLIDLVLLIEMGLPDKQRVAQALQATFERRKTHEMPMDLSYPPETWQEQYRFLAAQSNVPATNLHEAFNYVSEYWHSLQLKS